MFASARRRSMMSEQEDDKVGYRKPPTRTRFQPGVSGNPNGRRKGSVNLKTDLRRELSERIHIREGERSLKVSKQRAMLRVEAHLSAASGRGGSLLPYRQTVLAPKSG